MDRETLGFAILRRTKL